MMVTLRGRPRRPDNDVCPKCGRTGYFHKYTSWNPLYNNDSRRIYYKFIHHNRGLRPCYIGKQKSSAPLQVAREYNRKTDTVTTFLFHPQKNSFEGVIKQWKKRKAIRVIVCSFSHIPTALKP